MSRRPDVQIHGSAAAWPTRPDARRLVGAVVVEHELDVQLRRHTGVDPVQESATLERPMATMSFCDHIPRFRIEGGKQGRGAVALVVMPLGVRLCFGVEAVQTNTSDIPACLAISLAV